MIINGIDVRRYGATLLTAETKPPKMTANYEMMSKALLPTEYDTDIPLGSMTMTIYFRGKGDTGKNNVIFYAEFQVILHYGRNQRIQRKIQRFSGWR